MSTLTSPASLPAASAIRRVTCFKSSPVMTCDRCSAGIAMVNSVLYADGTRRVFGSECINKILGGDTSLKTLFKRNSANLLRCQRAVAALEMGDAAPVGSEYYGAGLFFIADADGEDVRGEGGKSFWHPIVDVTKNAGSRYAQDGTRVESYSGQPAARNTPEHFAARARSNQKTAILWFKAEIDRVEKFLASVLATGAKRAAAAQPASGTRNAHE